MACEWMSGEKNLFSEEHDSTAQVPKLHLNKIPSVSVNQFRPEGG